RATLLSTIFGWPCSTAWTSRFPTWATPPAVCRACWVERPVNVYQETIMNSLQLAGKSDVPFSHCQTPFGNELLRNAVSALVIFQGLFFWKMLTPGLSRP